MPIIKTLKNYFKTIAHIWSYFHIAKIDGWGGVILQSKGLFFAVINWQNPKITYDTSKGSSKPYTIWLDETAAMYLDNGLPCREWQEIIVDKRWWVPGFNKEWVR